MAGTGNGWISLHRKIQNHWLWQDKPFDKRAAWIDILLMVNHKPGKIFFNNEIIEVGRGEKITSEVKLANKWGWSRTKVRTFLKLLEQDNMIKNIKENRKRTRLKVLNYSKYQQSENNKKTRGEQGENNRKTGAKQEQNINNNVNNVNNNNNDNKSNKDQVTLVRNFLKFQTNKFKKVLPPAKRPKFNNQSIPYKAAAYLRKLILENNRREPVPEKTPKDLENWAVELDRLNRLGPPGAKNKGYNWKEIGEIMNWCQDDSFWKKNIKSASKFRKQITKLEDKMKDDTKGGKQAKKDKILEEVYQEHLQEKGSVDIL